MQSMVSISSRADQAVLAYHEPPGIINASYDVAELSYSVCALSIEAATS